MITAVNATRTAAAVLAAVWMFAAAPAAAQCNTAAWTTTTGSPVAGGAADQVPAYTGSCGLKAATAGASFVTESTQHQAEGGTSPYHARFYVHTNVSGANPVVFRALTGEGTGSDVILVTYDSADQNFDFTVNGTTRSTAAGTAARGKWFAVQMTYQANGQFTAETLGNRGVAGSITAISTGAATIESVQLGNVLATASATGNISIDEFEASRAAGENPVVMLPRADADGDGAVNPNDITIVARVSANLATAAGQADCDEDGAVNPNDITCTARVAADLE